MSENPLSKLYRTKSVFIQLPSKGKFYDSGINLSVDGELGVMPMTARDEIVLKSPDSLFNGDAIVEIFKSCVPDIKDPYEIPACDIDPIIIAIRAASNPNLDIDVTCPQCRSQSSYQIELATLLASATPISEDNTIELSDEVTVTVRPYSLKSQLDTNIKRFYQLRMQEAMKKSEEERERLLKEAFLSATAITIDIVTNNILSVRVKSEDEDILVTNRDHIKDWVVNMDKETYKKVIGRITELSENGMMKSMLTQCQNCNHEYEAGIDLNPITFFT
jgi:hypothetical protein